MVKKSGQDVLPAERRNEPAVCKRRYWIYEEVVIPGSSLEKGVCLEISRLLFAIEKSRSIGSCQLGRFMLDWRCKAYISCDSGHGPSVILIHFRKSMLFNLNETAGDFRWSSCKGATNETKKAKAKKPMEKTCPSSRKTQLQGYSVPDAVSRSGPSFRPV